jgi:integrin alpha FG-GAP repeat containing protein 1
MDVLTLASDQHTLSVYLWSHSEQWIVCPYRLQTHHRLANFSFHRSASFRHPERIYNVVPGDYTHDGQLDLLVMSQSIIHGCLSPSTPPCPAAGFVCIYCRPLPKSTYDRIDMNPIEIPPSTLAQPIPFDSDGQMRIDLLGLQPGISQLSMWKNVWNASEPSGPLYEM